MPQSYIILIDFYFCNK